MSMRALFFYSAAILGVAAVLRFSALTSIPYGLSWDEAAYAANAHSLLLTGADEWGARFPLFLKSFGEYKPSLLSYLIALALPFFERPETATRFVSAILGMSSIVSTMLLVRVSTKSAQLAVLTGAVLAITPWHIHYSKTATDPIVGFAFFSAGLALWHRSYWKHQVLGSMLLVISMYAYNAERVIVPLLITSWLLWNIKQKSLVFRELWTKFAIPITGSVLLICITVFSQVGTRARETSLWHSPSLQNQVRERVQFSTSEFLPIAALNNKMLEFVKASGERYVAQFRPDFLFFSQAGFFSDLGFAKHGNLLFVLLPFCIYGIVKIGTIQRQARMLFILLLLLSPIPAALTIDGPHTGRSFTLVIPLVFFAANGIQQFSKLFQSKQFLQQMFSGTIIAIIFFATAFWWQDYLILGKKELNREYQGYSPVLSQKLSEARNSYDSIVINGENKGRHQLLYMTLYEQLNTEPLQQEVHPENIHTRYENISTVATVFDTTCAFTKPNTLLVLHPSDPASLELQSKPTGEIRSTESGVLLYALYETDKLLAADSSRMSELCQNGSRLHN